MNGMSGISEKNGQKPETPATSTTATQREPTKWINVVSDPKYAKAETEFRAYWSGPAEITGTVEYVGKGEALVGKGRLPSTILIVRDGNGKKYGFNLPDQSFFYMYTGNAGGIRQGDTVRIRYLGTANNTGFAELAKQNEKANNAHVFDIQIVKRAPEK